VAVVAADRLVSLLERIVPVASALARGVLALVVVGFGAAALIAVGLFQDGLPAGDEEVARAVIALAFALAPPVVLAAFLLALRELVELPARLRALPGTGREHASELGRLAREARDPRRPGRRFPGLLWRLARTLGSGREVLMPWVPLMPLLSVPFLLLSLAAAAAVLLETLVALAVLAALAA
jgi:hypothetical protein